MSPAPFLDADRIRAATFIRHVEIHDTLGSTNDRAAELAREATIELPLLVAARHQTAGKGRGQNSWWADDGALTFSILLEPAKLGISAANWPQLSLATAVAVCDALDAELTRARAWAASAADGRPPAGLDDEPARAQGTKILGIKWPNDVMLDGRKVCGILIESPGGAAPAKDRLIIGVGVNVNNSWDAAPPDAGLSGAALCDSTGRQHDLARVLILFLQSVQDRIGQLSHNDPILSTAWKRRCVLSGRSICIKSGTQHTAGTCRGIDSDGALRIETADGPRSIYGGTVA